MTAPAFVAFGKCFDIRGGAVASVGMAREQEEVVDPHLVQSTAQDMTSEK